MLILLTSEDSGRTEREQLIRFFENGLPLLHVRKPGMTEEELKRWLLEFEEEHLNKMVLHQHHKLAEAFPVKGIHLKESFRRERKEVDQYVEQFRANGCTVSTSFHDPEALRSEASGFDYVFLSPVFTSFSKSGHEGQAFQVEAMPGRVIALGGLEPARISTARLLGYAGVAVLGAVWLAENKQQAFTEIYDEYSNVYQ